MASTLKEFLATIDDLKSQVDRLRPLKPEQEQRVVQKLRLDWNYHSNAIEGNQLTPGETRMLLMDGITANGKPLKDYLDIKGHDAAITFLIDFIARKEDLTEIDVREMHRLLLIEPYEVTATTPEGGQTKVWVSIGQYKERENQVKTSTGQVRRFSVPAEVPAKMHELILRLRKHKINPELHPIAFASFFHHEFVSIHPFDDGNGRMARLLMNLILMQDHYPPAVIRVQDREKYFLALAQADQGEIEPLTRLIGEQISHSLELYLRAVKGESIEDYDDIDKKITLLVKELAEQPEPKEFSPGVYKEVVTTSISMLLNTILPKLAPFDSLFLRSPLVFEVGGSGLVLKKSVPEVIQAILNNPHPTRASLRFSWEHFKKAGINTFGHTATISVQFSMLTYELVWGTGRQHIQHLYADHLAKEECIRVANDIAEGLYNTIQNNRKANKF